MTPPTTTPRTDSSIVFAVRNDVQSPFVPLSFARQLETELACEKANRNHLIEKGEKLETELTAEREKVRVLREALALAADLGELTGYDVWQAIAELAATKKDSP